MNKTEIKKELKEVDRKLSVLSLREKALQDLLATYESSGNGHGNPATIHRRRPRRKPEEHVESILEWLRLHPDEEWTVKTLMRQEDHPDMSETTCYRVFQTLAGQKKATVIERSPTTLQYKAAKFKGN